MVLLTACSNATPAAPTPTTGGAPTAGATATAAATPTAAATSTAAAATAVTVESAAASVAPTGSATAEPSLPPESAAPTEGPLPSPTTPPPTEPLPTQTPAASPEPYAPAADDATLLPPAAAMPAGAPEDAAAALATQVLAGGDAGVGALRTALVHAGIGIVDLDGTVIDPPAKPSIGMNVQAGQLPLLVALAQRGASTTLNDLLADWSDILGTKLPLAAGRKAIAADYFAAASANRPAPVHFYALFLDALGSTNPLPNLLALDQDPDNVWLNGAQVFLILVQWAHDDVAFRAAHTSGLLQTESVAGAAADAGLPCTLGSSEQATSDAAGSTTATIAGAFWSWVTGASHSPPGAGPVPGSGGFGGAQVASIMLTVAQAIASAAMFDGDMQLSGNPPLVRTKSTSQPGEDRTLTVTVKFNVGKGQYANCLRYILNLSGQDFSLPNDGALKGGKIHWIMLDTGNSLDGPAQFYQLGGTSAVDTVTDDNGQSQTGLQGSQQRVEIPDNVPQVIKRVTVMAAVTVKPDTLFNDFFDAIGLPLAGVAAPVTILNNILQRTSTYDVTRTFSVQDWAKDFKIDANAVYDNGFGHYPHESIIKCAGIAGTWDDGHGFSFHLDKNGIGTYPTTVGPATITLILNGDGARLRFENNSIQQEWPVIPGDWCNGDTPK